MLKFRQVLIERLLADDDPHIVVNHKNETIGKYKNAYTARQARDRADLKYGAAVHRVKRVAQQGSETAKSS